MARKASTLDVKVNADTTGLERGYKRAGKETRAFTKQTNSLGDSIKGKLGAAFAGDIPENRLDADAIAFGVEERLLDDADDELAAVGRLIVGRAVDGGLELHHHLVVLRVAVGVFLRIKVVVGLAEQILQRHLHGIAVDLIGKGDAAFTVLAEEVVREVVDDGVVDVLGK